jgi:hypothetical protein
MAASRSYFRQASQNSRLQRMLNTRLRLGFPMPDLGELALLCCYSAFRPGAKALFTVTMLHWLKLATVLIRQEQACHAIPESRTAPVLLLFPCKTKPKRLPALASTSFAGKTPQIPQPQAPRVPHKPTTAELHPRP